MAKDHTKEVQAQIEPGALSERDQRIAAGLALVREGTSMKRAAQIAQVPRTTLMRYRDNLSKLGTSNGREQRLADVEELSFDIARIAGERIRESLNDPEETWKPGDLVKAYGTATDKTLAMANVTASGNQNAFAHVFKGLKDMGLTLQPERDETTIEAEATTLDDE